MNNYKRVTFSIPKATYIKLEINIPKNKRSKFVGDLIENKFASISRRVTYEEIKTRWAIFAKQFNPKSKKSAVEMQREERLMH